ncbi:hypothetical protein MMC30_000939 [Trapelia coarctata]|nr:hypothetical protein [Trapelia coarctata]
MRAKEPSQRSVLITGTSKGSVGSALAASFAAHGFLVFASLRDISKIDADLSALPNVHTVALDVTSDDSIAAALAVVAAKTDGSLNCLVNNAGFSYTMPLADVDMETARKVFDVNFWGVLSMTKAFMPLLRKAKGTVVNVSSVGALVPTPYLGIYSASKSALTNASETLRLELAPFGINVVTAMLGVVKSNLLANSPDLHLPPGSMYKPVEQQIREADSGKHVPKGMDPNKFAVQLVKDILNGRKGRVWRGNVAHVVKWASSYLPTGVFDGLISDGMGFDELVKINKKEVGAKET